MKVTEKVMIAAAPNARMRTKNRLNEHGKEGFKVGRMPESVQCFNGAFGIFLEAPDGWEGWLRWDELIILDI